MRTLLTYALAALVSALIMAGWPILAFQSGIEAGDPRMASGAVAALIVSVGMMLLLTAGVGSLVWAGLRWFLARIGRDVRGAWNVPLGVAVFALAPLVIFIRTWVTATDAEPGLVVRMLTDPDMQMSLLTIAAAGAAWGAVFWVRGRVKPVAAAEG
jgi:hypothetical protein